MDTLMEYYRVYVKKDAAELYGRVAYFMSDFLAYTVGCDFLTPTYKVQNFRFFFLNISLGLFFVCTFYTTYTCFVQAEYIMILECFSVNGMAVQGLAKLQLAVHHRHKMAGQCLDLLEMHKEFLNRPKRNLAMRKCAVFSDFMIK